MASKKRQHFVPQCYLKSWTINNQLFSMSKNNGFPRKQPTKTIAKRDNLYTIPSILFENIDSRNRENQELITENLLFKIWEDRWVSVRDALNNNENLNPVLHSIKGFIITQSFRTPKFLRLNNERIKRQGKDSENVEDPYTFAFLGTSGLTEYIKNCVLEIIQCNDIANFITSDNPATHWIQEGEMFYHLNGIALNNGLFKNPNYKILCPLHPKFFGVLTPNLGIEIPDNIKNQIFKRIIYNDTVKQLNQMTEHGCDKMLFAKSINDYLPK